MATQKQAYISAKEQEEGGIASKGKSIPGTNLAKLDSEEINKLTVFLKTINDRNCVFAQQGNCLHSVSLNASKTDKNDIGILNSRAPDHMTPDLLVFDTYEPIVTSKRITIANGTSVSIKGQGTFTLSPNITLQKVLHVPNLSTNLVSIHRFTNDLNCHANFSPNVCEFQALKTGKMIGAAREQHGLYFLEKK